MFAIKPDRHIRHDRHDRQPETVVGTCVHRHESLCQTAAKYMARTPDKNGTPFGMGVGIPEGTVFLAALD